MVRDLEFPRPTNQNRPMWLFTTSGFYSAVTDKQDPQQIQIRARSRKDLEAVVAITARSCMSKAKIIETPEADYRYRVVVHRTEFLTIMIELASEVTYTNFKDAAHRADQGDKPLMSVWSAMARYQDDLVWREHDERAKASKPKAPAKARPRAKGKAKTPLSRGMDFRIEQ